MKQIMRSLLVLLLFSLLGGLEAQVDTVRVDSFRFDFEEEKLHIWSGAGDIVYDSVENFTLKSNSNPTYAFSFFHDHRLYEVEEGTMRRYPQNAELSSAQYFKALSGDTITLRHTQVVAKPLDIIYSGQSRTMAKDVFWSRDLQKFGEIPHEPGNSQFSLLFILFGGLAVLVVARIVLLMGKIDDVTLGEFKAFGGVGLAVMCIALLLVWTIYSDDKYAIHFLNIVFYVGSLCLLSGITALLKRRFSN